MRTHSFIKTALLTAVFSLSTAGLVSADSFQASYLPAGIQTPDGVTTRSETFENITTVDGAFTTNFNGSDFIGTYLGGINITNADQYGGASGSGKYASTNSSYTLMLNKGANYFGLWFSALDEGNQLKFYRGSTLVYSFTPTDFINLVGTCPGSSFCGNPNGGDADEQFAFLNFYDKDAKFDTIVFTQVGGGGFESDNHSVAELAEAPGGTIISASPEPASLGLALFGGALALAGRWRSKRKTA